MDISFTRNHSSVGITLNSEGDAWITDIRVVWYSAGEQVLAFGDYSSTTESLYVPQNVLDYRRISITFYSANKPNANVKFRLLYGAEYTLSRQDIISAKIIDQIDPVSTQLYINQLSCKIHSDTYEFSILNSKGIFSFLQKRQRLDVYEYMDNNEIFMGTYYLDSINNETETVIGLEASDVMGMLDKTNFMGGMYVNARVSYILDQIFDGTGFNYNIDSSLPNLTLSGHIPICTRREALQQVVFAIQAIATSSRSDSINIYRQEQASKGIIGTNEKFYRKPVELGEEVSRVSVHSHKYTQQAESERQELLNDVLADGQHKILFSEPMHGLKITGASIVSSGTNYAVFELDSYGDVLLTGIPYKHQTRVHSYGALDTEEINEVTVESATLVSPDIANEITLSLYNHLQKRHKTTFGIITGKYKTSDVAQAYQRGGGQLLGTIEAMDIDLTGGFISDMTINFADLLSAVPKTYLGQFYLGQKGGI